MIIVETFSNQHENTVVVVVKVSRGGERGGGEPSRFMVISSWRRRRRRDTEPFWSHLKKLPSEYAERSAPWSPSAFPPFHVKEKTSVHQHEEYE